jgi:hypothetical protein
VQLTSLPHSVPSVRLTNKTFWSAVALGVAVVASDHSVAFIEREGYYHFRYSNNQGGKKYAKVRHAKMVGTWGN